MDPLVMGMSLQTLSPGKIVLEEPLARQSSPLPVTEEKTMADGGRGDGPKRQLPVFTLFSPALSPPLYPLAPSGPAILARELLATRPSTRPGHGQVHPPCQATPGRDKGLRSSLLQFLS